MKYHQQEYIELRTLIAEMSLTVTQMLRDSLGALVNRDTTLALRVIERDDEVDRLDNAIDTICLRTIALYQPKATDLRYVMTASRIIVDLERIGDLCVDICKEIINLNDIAQIKPYVDIPIMVAHASKMIQDAVDAFFTRDIERAERVIALDDFIDDLHGQVLRELLTYILEDVSNTRGSIWLMFIVRSLERVADHATNIAEQVVFMVTGRNIRHKSLQEGKHEPNTPR